MGFTVGEPKKKRGFLLAIDEGEPPGKDAKAGSEDYAEAEGESDEGGGDLEALAKEAGVNDLAAFMKFLPEALKRCK
jgi:hypothetical protein